MTAYHEEKLPDPLPCSPMDLAVDWFERAAAEAAQPNPDAMVLATADEEGNPSARVVLCKRLVADPGYLVFFTNYGSRKAQELERHPRAAAVFHWDTLRRQMRVEGCVERSPHDESDAYFASRSWQSRVGAWASRQSRPIESRGKLLDAVADSAASFGATFADGRFVDTSDTAEIARPAFWGGYRLWIDSLELWTEGEGRVHDRAVWSRELIVTGGGWQTGEWQGTRLQP
jgi:pyridoxamine 5'-phosphate oxidase